MCIRDRSDRLFVPICRMMDNNYVLEWTASGIRQKAFAFHNADTDIDILADIIARIVARMSACRSACHRTNFRKSRVSDVRMCRRVGRVEVGVCVGVVKRKLNTAANP